jgi:two-component system, LytTR family, response regulator
MSQPKWKVLIADDEPAARRGIRQLLANFQKFEVIGECRNGLEVISALNKMTIDVLFLDVQMPEMDGFEVIKSSRSVKFPEIVFLTAYDQFALKAFEVEALDYLVKPVSLARFNQTIERLEKRLSKNFGANDIQEKSERFLVQTFNGMAVINLEEIDWIESAGNYVRLWVGSQGYFLRESLQILSERLHKYGFRRAHRCALVKLVNVKELKRDKTGVLIAILKGGAKIPISRRRSMEFVNSFKKSIENA